MRGFSCFGWTAVSRDYLDELHHYKNVLADYKPVYEEAEERRRVLTNLLKEKIKLLQKTNLLRSWQDGNLEHLKQDLQKRTAEIEELREQNATKESLMKKLNIQVEKSQDNFHQSKHKVQLQKTKLIQQKEVIEQLHDKIDMLEELLESKNSDLLEKQEQIKMKSESCEQAVQEKEELQEKLNQKVLQLIQNDNELSKQVFDFNNLEIKYKEMVDALKEKECELVAVKEDNEKLKIVVQEKDKELIENDKQLVQRMALSDNFEKERSEIDSMLKERQQDLISFRKNLADLSLDIRHLDIYTKIREDLHQSELELEKKMNIADSVNTGCGDDQDMAGSEVNEDIEEKQITDHKPPMQTSGSFVIAGTANVISAQYSSSLDSLPYRKNNANLSLLRSTSLPYIPKRKKNSSSINSINNSSSNPEVNSGDQCIRDSSTYVKI